MAKPTKYTSKRGNKYIIHGGVYTGYTFENEDGETSTLGFEHPMDVQKYIEQRENAEEHFMDKLSDIKNIIQ